MLPIVLGVWYLGTWSPVNGVVCGGHGTLGEWSLASRSRNLGRALSVYSPPSSPHFLFTFCASCLGLKM